MTVIMSIISMENDSRHRWRDQMRSPKWTIAAALGTVTAVSLALSGATPALASAAPERSARPAQAVGPAWNTISPDSTGTPAAGPARMFAALVKPGDTWTGARLSPSSGSQLKAP